MKKNKTTITIIALVVMIATFMTSCDDDSDALIPDVPQPMSQFAYQVSSNNDGVVSFTNSSLNAASYLWDFGDSTGTSTDENPTHTYATSGDYTVTLTTINISGEDMFTQNISVTVDVFTPPVVNLVMGGDMSDETQWTFRQVWNDPNNQMNAQFQNDQFFWDAADGTDYAQTYFWQEVAIEADVAYTFSADLAATDGIESVWFEVYFGNEDPATADDYGSNGKRLNITDAGCASEAFDGNIVTIARGCDSDGEDILPEDGSFTLSADELTENGTIFLVFKTGTWDSLVNYKEGITLDNVSITEQE